MYQHINEIEGLPEIGQMYWVPCITSKRGSQAPIKNVPVTGTIHQDKFYFDVEWKHIHFDVRFIAGRVQEWLEEDACITEDPASILNYAVHTDDLLHGPYDRLLRCMRHTPVFRLNNCEEMVLPLQQKLPQSKRRLPAKCMRCPHRGTPLNGIPLRMGVVVCPAHGLAFDVETREMVIRSADNPLDGDDESDLKYAALQCQAGPKK
jgi:hypothetical protein